jgi:arylsulfatase A-like enzyme
MGPPTPNIDRIAEEGLLFTDHYAQPSCTAGRAAFITGQYPVRSGMTTVGQPGDVLGLQQGSPCLAEILKAEGYATGHFGKNHLGDRNEHLPTAHGFDEFFGNLYHLNTQEEIEQRDYQNFGTAFSGSIEEHEREFGTRGVIHAKKLLKSILAWKPPDARTLRQDQRTGIHNPVSQFVAKEKSG